MIASLLRRLCPARRRVQPVYSGHRRLAILNEGTPEVEARIDALKARFGRMPPKEIGEFLNTKSSTLIAVAKDWGLS